MRFWERGSTANNVFELKHSFHEPSFGQLIELFRMFPSCSYEDKNRARVWEHAIHHLFLECSMREAGIQEFFSEGNIVPLTIVYEDFVQEYEKTVRNILEFLELDTMSRSIPSPSLAQTADHISEELIGTKIS